jgi:hypothetical protein
MRMGIDAHCKGQTKTGSVTYAYNLVKHLRLLKTGGIDSVVYLTSKAEDDGGIFGGPRGRIKLSRLLR